jgi:hypothetical protein
MKHQALVGWYTRDLSHLHPMRQGYSGPWAFFWLDEGTSCADSRISLPLHWFGDHMYQDQAPVVMT